MLKKNKGITLIVLIITIIVLLILAVVAIGVGKYLIGSSNNEHFKVTITESGREYTGHTNRAGGTGSDGTLGKATVGTKVEKNSTIDGKTYSSTNPIIPAGFIAINTFTSAWDAATGPEVDNGLVIADESGNEFVWVPVVEEISTTEYKYTGPIKWYNYREPDVVIGTDANSYDAVEGNLQSAECIENSEDSDEALTSEDFKVELTKMYKSMAESVNEYGGFYVGRFETSKNGDNPQSKRSTAEYGSSDEIKTAYGINWYELYALNKKYSTSSVQGSMMWGSQYDAMMIWMGDVSNTVIEEDRNKNRTCGTAEKDVIKNVYDLYGNSYEWTLEALSTDNRIYRGGIYYSNNYTPRARLSRQSE